MKTQFKKSLSLFLAVLMVLTCWVWVAPPLEAEAASMEDGNYYVRVYGNLTDNICCNISSDTWSVDYKTNNGLDTGTTGNTVLSTKYAINSSNGNNITFAEGWITGWPTALKASHKSSSSKWFHDCAGRFENLRLQVQKSDGTWVDLHDAQQWNFNEDGVSHTFSTKAELYPVASSMANPAAVTLKVPEIGSGKTASTTAVTPGIYDQYGVRMTTTYPDSYSVANSTGDAITGLAENYGAWATKSGNAGYVTIDENIQKLHTPNAQTNSDGTVSYVNTIALKAVKGSYSCLQIINLEYPEYTVTVNGNGATGSATNALIDMSSGADIAGSWSASGGYGTSPSVWPLNVATKTGYTFKGFWTNQQPTTGDASYNAYEADFATPVSTTDYNTHASKEGATVANGIVTLATGEKYCDAGTAWNPDQHDVNGNVNYYGWWVSTDITVKFYDIDGSYLDTKTYKYGQKGNEVTWATPSEGYSAGAYEYATFANIWQDVSGEKIPETSAYTFTRDLILTPTYTTKTYKDQYTINFIEPVNGTASYTSGKYNYRYILGSEIPTAAVPTGIANDAGYSYEFAGWTTLVPSNSKYHIIEEDNTSFDINSDWVVREDVTYYPVFRSTVKKYVVQFNYTDTTGTKVSKVEYVPYGAGITSPDYVNKTYAADGMGYELQGWKYLNAQSTQTTMALDATLLFTQANVLIATANLADGVDEKAIVFEAAYDEGTPMPYTVTFKYKDAKGGDAAIYAEVYNKTYITQETVNELIVPATYDDGAAQYTFANKWVITEGTNTSGLDEYTKDDFTSFTPKSHVTFEAVYGEGVPYYTVTYIDGEKSYSEKILKGSNVPAWMVETGETDENGDPVKEEYVPKDYESETGTYEFAGWFDEKQTDTTYTVTNGTEYTTASVVTGDVTLYAQYTFVPFKFTIKFMDYTGTVQLAAGEYEYGQKFDAIFAEAQRAAQYRAPDETYSYTFIGWDQPYNEDNLVCEGKDVTFIAQYKPNYIYYDANWYNSLDDMNNGADALATTHHTYNSKVYAPSVKTTAPSDAPAGKTYVFAGWYYEDANGEAKAYVRGMAITAEMSFYATYTLVTEAHTVTAVVDGVSTEYKVADGETAKAVPTPGNSYVDETYHKNFTGWTKDGVAFDIDNTPITESITITAQFSTEEHNKNQKELISAPTYYVAGSEKIWCSCSRTETEETVEIAKLTDKVAPTGTIYLGTQGKWSSTDAQSGAADTKEYYANDNTDVIITLNDTGDVNTAYNPSGAGIGIKMIRGFVSSDTFTADQQGIASQLAITIFQDASETQNNTANYTFKVKDLAIADLDENGNVQYDGEGNILTKSLVDGETYIIYYYAIDKANNVLNKNVRTAKFVYDATAPTFTIDGNSNKDKVSGTPTYCKTAVIKGVENEATLTINGEPVELSTAGVSGATAYTINTAGNYIITVTDKAGNSTSKKIVVAADHTEVTVEKAVTCEEDGYKKVTCAICGTTIAETTTTSEGHDWEVVKTVEATCTAGGYTLEKCSVCGEERKTNESEAVDHNYAKDDNGDIIYTVVTKATCKTAGKKIANCTLCGGETITVEIPVDEENGHVYGGIKTLKPTCTEDGKYYQTCKYCYIVKDGEAIDATGHKETYKVVTTAATCGAAGIETEKCKKCDTVIATAEIPATGRHIVYEVERKEPTATEKGYIKYGCKTCDWTKTEEIDTLELYTVKFVNEDGSTIVELEDKVVGTTITSADVTEPTKAADDTYNYTFAGWVDAENNAVKLPFDVSEDITLKATFKATTIIYTHKFMVPTKWTTTLAVEDDTNIEFATIMGAYGDTNKKPVAEPTFSDADENTDEYLKSIYTFKFLGWSTTGAVGDIVTDFTVAGDATFYAVFEAVAIKYDVIFYNGTTPVWTTTVDGGETVEYKGETPTKAYDDGYHYAFAQWCTDEGCKTAFDFDTAITAKTRLYAKFNAIAHIYDKTNGTVTQEADCVLPELTEYACECGHKLVEETADASGHTPGEATTETVDGVTYSVVECTVCGEEISRTKTSVTVAFKNYNGIRLDTQSVEVGKAIVYGGAEPTRDPDAQNTYTFKGWYVEGDETKTIVDLATETATADIVYVADYTAETRTFRVTYVGINNETLQSTDGIKYGEKVPAFTGTNPVKAKDDFKHYTFAGWSVAAGSEVTSDLVIKPVFDGEDHTYGDGVETGGSCTDASGMKYTCTFEGCGHSYTTGGKPAAGHKYELVATIAPSNGVDGKMIYTCKVCGDTIEEPLPEDYYTIKVKVLDTNGNPVEHAKVSLLKDGVEVMVKETNNEGIVIFSPVERSSNYKVYISSTGETKDVTVDENGKVSGGNIESKPEQEVEDTSCKCTCHKGTFWGIIFRLFQKIIKFFTGKPTCCACPDSRI